MAPPLPSLYYRAKAAFTGPFLQGVVSAAGGDTARLSDVRFLICEKLGTAGATFSASWASGGAVVSIKATHYRALTAHPNDAHLQAYFVLKLIHELLQLCHRSADDPSHSTPEKFQCLRRAAGSDGAANVELGRWMEEALFGGWVEPLRLLQEPSESNPLVVLTESWAWRLTQAALAKIQDSNVWVGLPNVTVSPHLPPKPSGLLLSESDMVNQPVPSRRYSASPPAEDGDGGGI